jgi:hypothetical protein
MLYVLEVLQRDVIKKMPYSYSRRALNVLRQDIWRQKFACEDKEFLQKLMAAKEAKGEKCRIIECGS